MIIASWIVTPQSGRRQEAEAALRSLPGCRVVSHAAGLVATTESPESDLSATHERISRHPGVACVMLVSASTDDAEASS